MVITSLPSVIKSGDRLIICGSYTFGRGTSITVSSGASFLVKGNLTLTSATLTLESNATFVVQGNLTQNKGGIFSVGSINDSGCIAVIEGNYEISSWLDADSYDFSTSSDVYVFGDVTSSISSSGQYKNKTDLINDKNVSSGSAFLPIELTSFSVEQNGSDIDIAWTTNSEVNNDYFTVECSTNGVSFKTVEIVAGSGTTSEINEYAISVNASNFSGLVYFRLKQTDYNGEYSYSDVITLAVESSNELYVYPNPATEIVSVSGTYKTAIVQDMFGKKVAVATNGEQIYVGNLSAGSYYVVVATENGKKVLPLVKE